MRNKQCPIFGRSPEPMQYGSSEHLPSFGVRRMSSINSQLSDLLNLQFLNNVIIIKNKVLLPQVVMVYGV